MNNLQKLNFYIVMNFFLNFVEKNLHLIVGTTQYCDTQQTKHKHNKQYTTQNT